MWPRRKAESVSTHDTRLIDVLLGLAFGALAGYPLIKQCLNQGYEVIEYIDAKENKLAEDKYLLSKVDELIQRLEKRGSPREVAMQGRAANANRRGDLVLGCVRPPTEEARS